MTPGQRTLRVVFADDNFLVRQGTAALLAEVAEVDVVRLVADPHALMAAVEELSPDAVLTDIRMPPTFTTEGIEAAKRIPRRIPGHRRGGALAVRRAGVRHDAARRRRRRAGVPAQGAGTRRRRARAGPAGCVPRRFGSGPRGGGEPADPPLRAGRGNAAIARQMYLSERAVETHISAVFQKLDLPAEGDMNRRVVAVLTFLEAGGG